MRLREYGASPRTVILLHGGPGAPGYLAPLARDLSDAFHVLEPFQRRRGTAPLTVARLVADLHELCEERSGRPVIAGHSWGAMLALAFAAAYPRAARALVLIGCGTFDAESREAMLARRDERLAPEARTALEKLGDAIDDPDEHLRALGNLLLPAYSYAPMVTSLDVAACDARGHEDAMADMLRLQDQGVYPAAFAAVRVPVLMLHGAADPHPGRLIRRSLQPYLPQLEYREWERCGHYPWLEAEARTEFLDELRRWLAARFTSGQP